MKKIILAAVAVLTLASCGPKSFTFVQLSDPQVGFMDRTADFSYSDSLMKLAVNTVNRIKPDVVIVTGDLVNDPTYQQELDIYKKNIAAINPKTEVYALPGNHDIRPWTEENHKNFLKFNGYDRFSFVKNDCAFIGFDSCCIKDEIAEQEADQLVWLVDQLKAAQGSRQIFVFTHCPIFRESIDEEEDYFNFSKPKRLEYLELFQKYGVSAVFAGHTHKDYKSSWNDIKLFTAGPVGTPLDGGYSGFNEVHVGKKGFSCAFISSASVK